jgi:hypothetical protein
MDSLGLSKREAFAKVGEATDERSEASEEGPCLDA